MKHLGFKNDNTVLKLSEQDERIHKLLFDELWSRIKERQINLQNITLRERLNILTYYEPTDHFDPYTKLY